MERLIFSKSVALATTPTTEADIKNAGITDGAVALYDDTGNIITKALTKRISSFSLYVGGGAFASLTDYYNNCLSIDTRRFNYTKSNYEDGVKFSAEITIPTPVKGKDYTLTMAKSGTVLNERYKWSATERAVEGMTAAILAKKLGDQLASMGKNENFTATVAAAKITITGLDYQQWNLIVGDALFGTTVTVTKAATAPINDDAALAKLQEHCIGAEGINSTERDAIKLYKLPVRSSATGWTVYTLTYYPYRNLRSGGNENVKTIIHLAVPVESPSIATLDTIFASILNPAAPISNLAAASA